MRVGLIGCGRWGRNILRDLKSLGCEVAVATASEESVAAARRGGADSIVAHLRGLPEVEGVVVAVPTSRHGEVVLELLDARRCPVFCEKPLTASVAEAREIAARGAGRVFVMDKWRYHPGVEALRDIARSGELGPVLGLATVRLGWGNPHPDVDASWILLPHDLSIALEVLGSIPRPLHAVAERDASGLMALSAWLNGAAWLSCEVCTRYPGHRRALELRCVGGVAALDDAYASEVRVLRSSSWAAGGKPPRWEARPIAATLPLEAELRAFLAHLGGGPPPRSSAAEGLRVVETIAQLRALAALPG